MTTTWSRFLTEQLDWHWTAQLRPRLDGLSDDEYLWEPVPGAWTVHPRGEGRTELQGGSGATTIDFAFPEPQPAPVTTIAWRLAHVVVGVLGTRTQHHFGGPPADYLTFDYAPTAGAALAQLDEAYAGWRAGVRGWDDEALLEPCGPAEGQWSEHSRAELVLHINREVIHHGAEVALLRDLYAHHHR
ncbi:MAG TPA: DinB family protein [Intrasporangium sp.]|uniref:DinB family protein n=1 Tax=Intrasporangium sp. TaxID=1925024 RepID=UPI002D76A98A|nr:DinB family protein [Intrasporangium sp.]HET7399783.1 DinB family protein [Intrasporangium sp.]